MKKQQMMADRDSGMTYQQIADKYGVSKQYVGIVCGKANTKAFQVIKEDGCIYPNLRNWMNKNKVSRGELIRMMGATYAHQTFTMKLSGYMRGESEPKKGYIDNLLRVTGMTYEELFYREDLKHD